jgi:two-component system, OmpR family, sensor histidine kinase VicK
MMFAGTGQHLLLSSEAILSEMRSWVSKKRGLRLRYITEITNSNIPYCKELANLVELRHFDGLKGNFGIIDGKEYLATANLQEGKSLPHLVYSNVSEIIMQQQLVFDTLWYKESLASLKLTNRE